MVHKTPAIYCPHTATLVRYSSIEQAVVAAARISSGNIVWTAGFFVPHKGDQPSLDESLVD